MKRMHNILIGISSFAVVLMFSSIITFAAPLDGIEQVLSQPNGTNITLYFHGDEIYNYMTDESGNIIIQNPDNDYYVYATLSNGEIIPTDYVYGESTSGGTGGGTATFLSAEDIPQEVIASSYQNSRFAASNNELSTMSLDYEDKNLNGMNINNIVVFIRFSDTSYSTTTKSYYDSLFNTGTTSAKNYYDEISYGKIGVNSSFYPATASSTILTYRDSHPASYYKASNYNYSWKNQLDREQSMFKSALEYVADQIPSSMDLDKNNDGCIDMITFVLPGRIVSGSNQVCWPHQWGFDSEYEVTINGAISNLYNVQIEGAFKGQTASDGTYTFQNGSAIICHETLHILGFPDMYYYNYSYPTNKKSLGKWEIMCESNGANPTSYMKCIYGGWLDIPEIKESGNYSLNQLAVGNNCAYKIRSPYSANEYFIVEYRKKSGNFETNIPSTGLAIYRVLANHNGSGNANASSSTGTDDELRFLSCKASGSYSPVLSDNSTSGITISSISASGTMASFNVSFANKTYLTYFKDKNLVDAICSAIGKPESSITNSDLHALTSLNIYGGYISSHMIYKALKI